MPLVPASQCRMARILALATCLALVFQVLALVAQFPGRTALAAPTVCATPGADGAPGAPLTGIVNTYFPGRADAPAGATSISVGGPSPAGNPGIAAGDMLLVIQVQDALLDASNTGAYGDGKAGDPATGSTNLQSSGLYEYVRAAGPVAAGSVPIAGAGASGGLLNSYHATATTADATQHKFQVVRVPQYSSAALSAGLTAASWDGAVGGVLAIDVAGNLNLGSGTAVTVSGAGFRGGAGRQLTGGPAAATDYRLPSPAVAGDPQPGNHASKAEGVAGTPRWLFDPVANTTIDFGADALPNGGFGRGAPGNGGGGGNDGDPLRNDQNSGGGGGGNGGSGGMGGHTWNSNLNLGGFGGSSVGPSATRLSLGGGGGAGTRNDDTGVVQASAGTSGGGAVLFRVGGVTGTASISANGRSAFNDTLNDGGGGGGAGGSILVQAPTGVLLTGLALHADGARGGDTWRNQPPGTASPYGANPGNRHGPGGGGGGGVVLTSAPPAAATTDPGANGITTTAADPYGAAPGLAGVRGSTTALGMEPGGSAGAICLPSLTVSKSTSTPTVVQGASGTSATYTISVRNAVGQGDAINTAISDALPPNFSFASTSSITFSGGATQSPTVAPVAGSANPTWGSFTIPGGGGVQVTFVASIGAAAPLGTYQNPATATYADPARTTPAGTVRSQYSPGVGTPDNVTLVAPDLTVTKTHAGNFTRGAPGSYSVVASNSGTAPTSGSVSISDTLPARLTPTGAAGSGWTCPAPVGQVVTCSRSDGLPAGTSYPAIAIAVLVLETAPSTVTNTVTVSGGGELNTANDSASDPTTIVSSADLSIQKSHLGSFTVGRNGTYTLSVANAGPSTAAGPLTVSDTLPPGLVFVSGTGTGWSCSAAGQAVSCTNPNPLLSGASTSISLVVAVGPTAGPSVTNTAMVSSPTPDPVPGNNASGDPTTVTLQADVSIVKSHSGSFTVGQNGTYTLALSNAGPNASGSLSVSDNLPPGMTFVSGTGGGFTCSAAGQAVTCSGGASLAPGARSSISLVVAVGAAAAPAVTNSATVSATKPDPTPGNNTSSDLTTVVGSADLALAKTVDNPSPLVGQDVTFTVTAANNGPNAATGVTISDPLPPGLLLVSATPSAGTTFAGGTWTVGTLANAASATLTIVATVTQATTITNVATVTHSDQADPTPADDTASAQLKAGAAADIQVSKTASSLTPHVGDSVTFTVGATNNGPSDATGVVITDPLPPGLTLVSASPSQGTYSGGAWTVGALANGASATLLLTASVDQAGSITNTATKTAEKEFDPRTANDSASVTLVAAPSADIRVLKTVDRPAPHVGDNVVYTVQVTDLGPSSATGVQVADPLPNGLTQVSANPSQGSFAAGAWTVGGLGAGVTATLTITATVTQAGTITNTASKVAENEFDPNPGNDSASATFTASPAADIQVTKSVDNPAPAIGQNVTFTVVARDNGPSAASGVQVTDNLPAGLTLVSASTSQGTYAGGLWVVGALANGGSATLTVTATVGQTGQVVNTARKTAETEFDPNTTNDSGSASLNGAPSADIAIVKSVDNPTPHVGDLVTFTVTATDRGPSNATGVMVSDPLPTGLTLVSAVPSQGTFAGGTWNAGAIANGASATLVVTAAVTRVGPLTNTATKSAETEFDAVVANNTASVTINAQPAADISLGKSVDQAAPTLGQNVTFTVTATNNGPNDATGVQVTDVLPAGLSLVSSTPSQGTYSNGVWSVGSIPAGGKPTLAVVATVTRTGTTTNTATRTAENEFDRTTADDSASASVVVAAVADISVTKTVSNPAPNVGEAVTFTVTARDLGPDDATGVMLSDLLPDGFTLVSATPSQGAYDAPTGAWTVGAIANGGSATLLVAARVTRAGALTNTASKSGEDQLDNNPANDSATVSLQAAPVADLEVMKTHSGDFTSGSTGVYTLVVTNHGPSPAAAPTVVDSLPVGLTFASSSNPDGWSCAASGQAVTCVATGPLASGASSRLDITVAVDRSAVPSVSNTAVVRSPTRDPVPANNSSTDVGNVLLVDLALHKGLVGGLTAGQNATYTLTVTNVGTGSTFAPTTVADTLPAGLTLVSAGGSGWTCSGVGTVVTCTYLSLLAPRSTTQVTLVVAVGRDAAGMIRNSAVVATAGDANVSNNSDALATSISVTPPPPGLPRAGVPVSPRTGSRGIPGWPWLLLVLTLGVTGGSQWRRRRRRWRA